MNNNKNNLKYPSVQEMEKHHNHLIKLINDPSLERSFDEQENILQLKLKGFDHLKKTYSPEELDKKQKLMYSKEMQLNLANVGLALEGQEFYSEIKNEAINSAKMSILTNKLTNKLAEKLELTPMENKEEKITEDLNENLQEDYLDISNENDVQLDDKLIETTLVEEAQRNNNVKEVVMEGAYQNNAGQVASSAVVNLSQETIRNTVQNLDAQYNGVEVEQEEVKKPKQENENNAKEDKDKKQEKKFDTPKPSPEDNNLKKKAVKEQKKNDDTIKKEAKIEEYVASASKKQEKGIVLDTETFSSNVTLIDPKKVNIMSNIMNLREKSLNLDANRPEVVVESSGLVTQRRKVV